MNFFQALNIKKQTLISLVGGGGKTTTMFAIAKEAKLKGYKTVLTTTTKIFYPDEQIHNVLLTESSFNLLADIKNKLRASNEIVVGTSRTDDGKLLGINANCMSLFFEAGADIVLCEADGSAGKSFKGEADHEPVIPSICDTIIHVTGVDSYNQPISHEYVHRPEIIANVANVPIGAPLNDEVISTLLVHSKGYKASLTNQCQWVPFINKVESSDQLVTAQKIAECLRKKTVCKVLIGAAVNSDPIIKVLR
ncbi:hypothetical protein BKP35_06395 [Anaerobacillus arseniciselenatis]|uniref:Hydroxylase n=1 Tax=Anaerobacillus arseniciselenatis TaxID=85682 RepID=A0A1S2LQA2_9BACI|nr:selenium cofactor biosynthesis protein YqeC [Anaerobacillus arseniciselenatis]OIJ14504.1 hypothetical protein BKP35_06395 [Anaerobacillus arseniciselenatis]